MVVLDKKDAKILALVQLNNRLTSEQIGDQIGLSHTGVVRRLKRLRDTDVIVADVSIVSPEALGYPVRVNVSCVLDRDPPDVYERFKETLKADPHVISADCVMGEADFTFTVVAPSIDAYGKFRAALMESFPSMRKVTCLGVLEQVKRGTIPVARLETVDNAGD